MSPYICTATLGATGIEVSRDPMNAPQDAALEALAHMALALGTSPIRLARFGVAINVNDGARVTFWRITVDEDGHPVAIRHLPQANQNG